MPSGACLRVWVGSASVRPAGASYPSAPAQPPNLMSPAGASAAVAAALAVCVVNALRRYIESLMTANAANYMHTMDEFFHLAEPGTLPALTWIGPREGVSSSRETFSLMRASKM